MRVERAEGAAVTAPQSLVAGEARMRTLVESNAGAPGVLDVSFAPGARTHWHSHPQGQLLLVTGGVGLVATRDGAAGQVAEGDVVWSEPGEWHWHGAAPSASMTHVSVQHADAHGTHAHWGAPVTDDEYEAAQRH